MRTISVLGVVSLLFMLVCFPVLAEDAGMSPERSPAVRAEVQRVEPALSDETSVDEMVEIGVATPLGAKDYAAEGPGWRSNILNQGDVGEATDPHILWGTDVLVRDGRTPTWGDLALDHAEANDDLYAAVLVPGGGGAGDTVEMYRSTDGGATWIWWDHVMGNAASGGIVDMELRVGPGANPWIYTFILQPAAGIDGGLWVRRRTANFSAFNWTQILAGGDTISEISADRSTGASWNLFTSYIVEHSTGTRRIRLERSTDEGLTWVDRASVSSGERPTVRIAAGGDDYLYIAYPVDTTLIRIGRSTSNGVGGWTFNDVMTDGEGDWRPWVAGARTTPGTSQAAWCLFRHRHSNGNIDLHVAYSDDGGATWTEDAWEPTNYWSAGLNMDYTCLRYGYNYSVPLVVASAVVYTPAIPDTVVTAWARTSTPNTWEDRQEINDWDATGEFGPRIDCVSGTGGPAILYRRWGSDEVYFDYWWGTGVEERMVRTAPQTFTLSQSRPNPFINSTSISFTIPDGVDVDLTVHDVAGRRIATLASGDFAAGTHYFTWDGRDEMGREVATGTYFYRLTAGNFTSARKMILLR